MKTSCVLAPKPPVGFTLKFQSAEAPLLSHSGYLTEAPAQVTRSQEAEDKEGTAAATFVDCLAWCWSVGLETRVLQLPRLFAQSALSFSPPDDHFKYYVKSLQ